MILATFNKYVIQNNTEADMIRTVFLLDHVHHDLLAPNDKQAAELRKYN